ncbi:Uma2 family endonuclease [Kitasatospora sp. NPDC059747]|uniref:Uma2 family endonuclease n=1 Tax=Kitasatospora sp. NPDC059747 TaxID=3346930 RepID=UPI0036638FEE
MHTELIEGVVAPVRRSWADSNVASAIREQLRPRLRELGLFAGSGDLDFPGTANRYVPHLAVIPAALARTEGALLPEQTLLVVEAVPPGCTDTSHTTSKRRRRYAQFGAPGYLLVDRGKRTWTLFTRPGEPDYALVEGPYPLGFPIRLPAPLDVELATGEF